MSTFRPKSFNTYVARQIPRSVSALLNQSKPPKWAISLAARKAQQFDRWRVEGTPFLVGQKRVHLPKFNVTFLHTPNLSANWAQFEVPLHFNKLDMRDYLFHAYNVTTKAIRSFIPPVRVERRLRALKPAQRRRFRPKGIKKMTVELEKPFVWPQGPDAEKPEDWRPWDRERYRESMGLPATEEQEKKEKRAKAMLRQRVPSHESTGMNERDQMRKMAEDLLSGKKIWGPVDPNALPGEKGASLPCQ